MNQPAGRIQIERTMFWESPRTGCRLNAHIYGYGSAKDRRLIGAGSEQDFDQQGKWHAAAQTVARLIYSDDEGETWKQEEPFSVLRETDEGTVIEMPVTAFLDPRNDVCLFFSVRRWVKDPRTASIDIKKYSHPLYRISRDGARSWDDERVLIQKGPEYDQTHYLRGIRFGYNAGFVSNDPIQRRDGTILVPFFVWPWDEQRKRHSTRKLSTVLMGTWTTDLARIEWDLGEYIEPTGEMNSLDEIAVAELQDGSILGIMRTGAVDPTGAPTKAYCLSHDGGRTWSTPEHLTYDDGRPLYSPSSFSRLIRSSRNGKLYWIANILPYREDMYANMPHGMRRFILQIAEVNEENYGIKAETVTTIDQSEDPADPQQYSNHRVYEDRSTGDLILTMCQAGTLPGRTSRHLPKSYQGPSMSKESFTSDSYKYVIRI